MKVLQKIKGLQSSKAVFVLLLFATMQTTIQACEICGCSGSGYHFGILPQFKKNVIGIRHTYRNFFSQHLISEQLLIKGNTSNEYFNTTELWGRYYIGKKIQLFAFVPFNNFRQVESGVSTTASGIGDITLAANYKAYDNADDLTKKFKQTLLVGGGIKLPTGSFRTSSSSADMNPSINTGSGSVDFLTNVIYTCRYKRFGLNTDVNYRINTTNQQEFAYGNRLTTAAKFFYWKDVSNKFAVLPNAGIMFEHLEKDRHYDEKQNFSGGNITTFTAGVELYIKKINIGITYNQPLSQDLSKSFVKMNRQLSASINFMF